MLELNSGRFTFRIFIFLKRVLMLKCGFYTGLVLEGKHDARSRPAILTFYQIDSLYNWSSRNHFSLENDCGGH